jgi:hypothetical protein
LRCFGQVPATAPLADSVAPAARLSLNGCAQPDHVASELNHTAGSLATSRDLPEAPSAVQDGPASGDAIPDVSGIRVASPGLELERDTNRSGRTLDRQFLLLHTLSAVALVADLESTVRSLQGQTKAAELNPLFGAHPTRARLYGVAVPLNALSFYLSYRYKKREPGRGLWKVGPGLTIAVHTAAVINNLAAH